MTLRFALWVKVVLAVIVVAFFVFGTLFVWFGRGSGTGGGVGSPGGGSHLLSKTPPHVDPGKP